MMTLCKGRPVAGMVRDLRASGRHVPAALLALAGADLAAESLAE